MRHAPHLRSRAPLWITGAVFFGAFLSRSIWFYDAPFHPDESTVLWMALDAVRHPQIPEHGLVFCGCRTVVVQDGALVTGTSKLSG